MRLYCVRHGESVSNVENIFSNRDPEIHPLTEQGRQQVEQLAGELAARDVSFDAIYSSDLLRSVQTARIIGERLGMEAELRPDMREHDAGDVQGRSDAEAWALYNDVILRWFGSDDPEARLPGGESLTELQERFRGVVKWMEEQHGPDATLLLVGHGGFFLANIPVFASNISGEFVQKHLMPNAALTREAPIFMAPMPPWMLHMTMVQQSKIAQCAPDIAPRSSAANRRA